MTYMTIKAPVAAKPLTASSSPTKDDSTPLRQQPAGQPRACPSESAGDLSPCREVCQHGAGLRLAARGEAGGRQAAWRADPWAGLLQALLQLARPLAQRHVAVLRHELRRAVGQAQQRLLVRPSVPEELRDGADQQPAGGLRIK